MAVVDWLLTMRALAQTAAERIVRRIVMVIGRLQKTAVLPVWHYSSIDGTLLADCEHWLRPARWRLMSGAISNYRKGAARVTKSRNRDGGIPNMQRNSLANCVAWSKPRALEILAISLSGSMSSRTAYCISNKCRHSRNPQPVSARRIRPRCAGSTYSASAI